MRNASVDAADFVSPLISIDEAVKMKARVDAASISHRPVLPYADSRSKRRRSNTVGAAGSAQAISFQVTDCFAFTSSCRSQSCLGWKPLGKNSGKMARRYAPMVGSFDFRGCLKSNICFTKSPSDVLDHATSEIASGSKLGIDATKKIPGEGFKRPWPPLIKMDEGVQKRMDVLFKTNHDRQRENVVTNCHAFLL